MTEEISTINFDDWEDNPVDSQSNALEISALCCDEEIKGFDKDMGKSWIYPTNYPVRDYQFNIVQSTLFKNTLVSLPTGLGKTFIAAVVMYNFYRWYPQGKIIFTAPTRPLVAQQIEACYNIMAIPPGDTIEMTGSMQTANRKIAWQKKRVFYATPQVIQNDLESGSCPAELIRCIVIDEAHRARGKHSYCQIMETLNSKQLRIFRVLALSATPGGKVDDVINVVKNLHISHLELRTETSLDVANFTHSRKIETVEISLGSDLSKIRQEYIEILDIYTRRLVQHNILNGNIGNFSKGRIIMLFKEYQAREKSNRHPQHKHIMFDFTMVITLYHALELLTKHGSRVFLKFFEDHTDKTWVGKDNKLTSFLDNLRNSLGVNPFNIDQSPLPNGTIPEIKENLNYGHPKFDKLKQIILTHFNDCKNRSQDTKAIIFCEYRESVNLVHCLLLQCRPIIKPQMFIGQGAGSSKDKGMSPFSQKKQLHVMKLFREGTCNVLVSTCVGEEGLDIGSVDLIICFDISTQSPVRLIQRCGRTGRERGGKVFILVTEGREHETLRQSIYQRDNLNNKILNSKELHKNLYSANPRMLPDHMRPVCQKMHITVKKENPVEKGQRNIKDMFGRKISFDRDDDFEKPKEKPFLTDEEFNNLFPTGHVPTSNVFPKESVIHCLTDENEINPIDTFSNWLEWQRNLQYTNTIGHSKDSEILCNLLMLAERKKLNSSLYEEPILIEEPSIKDIKNTPPVPTAVGKKCNNIKDMFMKITKKNKGPDTIYDIKLKETLLEMGINHNDDTNIDTICQKYKIENELLNLLVELKIDSSKYIINEKSRFEPIDIFSVEIKDKNVRLSDLHINKIDNMTDSIDQFMNLDFNDSSKICEIQKSKSEITTENSAIKSLEKYDHLSPKSQIPNISEDKLEDVNKELILENKSCSPERIEEKGLDFFGLDSLDDLFEESSLSNQPSTSPILCSQRPKIYSNCSKVEKSNNSSISNVQNITKTNKNDSSFLTVTQIINMIDENYEIPSNEMLKSPTYKQVDEDEIEIQKSPILTQNVSTKRKYEKLSIPSTSFVVLETSESSQSEDEQMKINNNEKCNDKIILEESCDLFSNYKEDVSPFFKSNTEPKSPSIIGQRSLSLKEKLHKSLKTKTIDNTSQKITESNSNKNDRNTFLSQFAAVEKSKINSDCNPNSKNANNPFESDDDFENILKLLPSPKKSPNIKHTPRKHLQYKKKKVRKKKCDFIEYEAELSSDSYDSSDDENHDSSNSQIIDTSLVEFICDEEIPVCNENIDMQAKYLQSVKSPIKTVGQFKIPKLINKQMDVFSQVDPDENISYELDSFCVGANEGLTQQQDMSELEIAEALLRKRKRRKRKKSSHLQPSTSVPTAFNPANDSPIAKNKKRKLKLQINSDSDSDGDFFV